MRIFLAAVGYGSALIGVPWLTALCIVLLAARYRAWEAILLGLFVDFLWLPVEFTTITFPYFTLASLVVVWIFEPLRLQFLR